MNKTIRTLPVLALALLACACQPDSGQGSNTPRPAAAIAAPAPASAPAAVPAPRELQVLFAVTGDEVYPPTGTVPQDIKQFSPNQEVFAELMLDGTAPQVHVALHWRAADGSTLHEDARVLDIAGRTPAIFSYRPDPAWAAGDYSLVFDVDGKPSWELKFQVH